MILTTNIHSCTCLNIRVTNAPRSTQIHVMHPRLVDLVIDNVNFSTRFLVCLLCQHPVCSWEPSARRHRYSMVKCDYESFESVFLPENLNEPTAGARRNLDFLRALNSSSYSPTFKVLTTFPSRVKSDIRDTGALEAVHLHTYPGHLADVLSDLCDVAIRHNQKLRHDILLAPHTDTDTEGVDLIGYQIQTRSDFLALCKGIWDREQIAAADLVEKVDGSFEDFIGDYLGRIDTAFSEMHAAPRRDSFASVDSMEAITFEGISDRFQRHTSPQRLSRRTFTDLPTETAWKILRFLEPVYRPADLLTVQDYHKELSMFARLSLVSKSWSELISPSLYHCIVLLSDPEQLNTLSQALKVHGSGVREVVIDDIDIGTVHIRTCSRYISTCLSLCSDLHHIRCIGDIGLDGLRMHTLSSLTLISSPWLPLDLPAAFRFAGPDLKRLDISKWTPLEREDPNVLIPSTLPQVTSFSISNSMVPLDILKRLLDSITKEGRHVLRELSIVDVLDIDEPMIFHLLKINALCTHITALRIRVNKPIQNVGNDNAIREILEICPCLTEFSYTTPASPEIFTCLPHTLNSLELAVELPDQPPTIPETTTPKIKTVEPFLRYLESPASKNIRTLSIVRQTPDSEERTEKRWRRLGMHTWDWNGELRRICKERNIRLSCLFVADIQSRTLFSF